MRVPTNCSLDVSLKKEALQRGLSFSVALDFGVRFKLAEIDDCLYPSNLLSHKIENLAERLAEKIRVESEAAGEKIYPEGYYDN